MQHKTDDKTLIAALRILANDIQCDDGIANACIFEAATRLEELIMGEVPCQGLKVSDDNRNSPARTEDKQRVGYDKWLVQDGVHSIETAWQAAQASLREELVGKLESLQKYRLFTDTELLIQVDEAIAIVRGDI